MIERHEVTREGRLSQGAMYSGEGCYGHNTFWPDGEVTGHGLRDLPRMFRDGTRIRVTTIIEVLDEPDVPLKTNPWHKRIAREGCVCPKEGER